MKAKLRDLYYAKVHEDALRAFANAIRILQDGYECSPEDAQKKLLALIDKR